MTYVLIVSLSKAQPVTYNDLYNVFIKVKMEKSPYTDHLSIYLVWTIVTISTQ